MRGLSRCARWDYESKRPGFKESRLPKGCQNPGKAFGHIPQSEVCGRPECPVARRERRANNNLHAKINARAEIREAMVDGRMEPAKARAEAAGARPEVEDQAEAVCEAQRGKGKAKVTEAAPAATVSMTGGARYMARPAQVLEEDERPPESPEGVPGAWVRSNYRATRSAEPREEAKEAPKPKPSARPARK